MKHLVDRFARFFENAPDMVRRRKWIFWALYLAVTVFAVFGVSRAKFDMTVEGWFRQDDPVKLALDQFKAEFGSTDNVYIVYQPADGDVFSAKSLAAVKGLRDELMAKRAAVKEGEASALKRIVNITTLENVPTLRADGDVLVSKPLVGGTLPATAAEIEAIRVAARSNKLFPRLYFSEDYKFGGIIIETDFGVIPEDDETAAEGETLAMGDMSAQSGAGEETVRFKPMDGIEYVTLMKELNLVLKKPEYTGHFTYYPVGFTPMNAENMEIIEREGGPQYLGLLLILALVIWLFTRSFSAVVWSLLLIVTSVIWTLGFTGWLGVQITVFVVLTVMLILTVGVCDATHIFSGYILARREGQDKWGAVRQVYRSSSRAIMLTCVTNCVGMLACVIVPIARVQVFGLMSAAGVFMAFVFTMFILPLMLDLWAPRMAAVPASGMARKGLGRLVPDFAGSIQSLLERAFRLVQKNPVAVVLPFLAVFLITLYGATKVKVDTNFSTQFAEGSPFRNSVSVVDKYMVGSQNMEIFLDLKKTDAFQDPFVLQKMEALQKTLESKFPESVVRTQSLVEVVKDASQKMNGGREEAYAIPADRQVLAQTLYLFNNANPEDRRKLVSDDYRKAHITVQLLNFGSLEYNRIYDAMQVEIQATVVALREQYPDAFVNITGMLPLYLKFADFISKNEVQSFATALAAVTLTLMLVFGSIRGGLLSLIPNLIPSTLTFGLLGLTGKSLDFEVMVLIPVIVGITVDDTVHFLSHYRERVRGSGDVKQSLAATIKEVGQATAFTSLILGLGFSLMAFSDIAGTAAIGKFGSLAILAGLLNDMFLLPALILIFKPTFGAKQGGKPESKVESGQTLVLSGAAGRNA